jgi:hypothetical protein
MIAVVAGASCVGTRAAGEPLLSDRRGGRSGCVLSPVNPAMQERTGPFWDGVEGRAPILPAAATLGVAGLIEGVFGPAASAKRRAERNRSDAQPHSRA